MPLWACSKLEHPECIKQLAAKNKSNTVVFNPCTTFIEMKEYVNSDLLYPFDSTTQYPLREFFQKPVKSCVKKETD